MRVNGWTWDEAESIGLFRFCFSIGATYDDPRRVKEDIVGDFLTPEKKKAKANEQKKFKRGAPPQALIEGLRKIGRKG